MRKLLPFIIIGTILLCVCLIITFVTLPAQASRIYGQPSSSLTITQRVQYSASLLWYDGLLTNPRDANGAEQSFSIQEGESGLWPPLA